MSQPAGETRVAPHQISTDDYEELRIALVMNGGVSLAVWIGGVTHEVNRAVRGDGVYGQLLALTATAARVDVISGTSAGGINGAFLALARAYNVDLAAVRNLWLDKGALDRLLHQPYDSAPTSLLRGNEGGFLEDLRSAFHNVRVAGQLQPANAVPVDLTLTTTVLTGEPAQLIDDLGQTVADVTHRGQFRFCRGEHVRDDNFAAPDIVEKLTHAARATASFPVAFEPVFCEVEDDNEHDKPVLSMRGIASFKKNRYLVDGGILDNKPLEAAIEAVKRQQAKREVRRVLAYVVPAPGHTAIAAADERKNVPTVGAVALASLIELPRVESISRELAQIVEHNATVRRRRETRTGLVRELGATHMRPLAKTLFATYQSRRRLGAAEYITEVVTSELALLNAGQTLGRRGREWLIRTLADVHDVPWVPKSIPAQNESAVEDVVEHWNWGGYTLEHMAALLLELLRRALLVSPLLSPSDSLLRPNLKRWCGLAYELSAVIPAARSGDRQFWAEQAESFPQSPGAPPTRRRDTVGPWLQQAIAASTARTIRLDVTPDLESFSDWPLPNADVRTQYAQGWLGWTIAKLIAAAAADLRTAARLGVKNARTSEDSRAAEDLRAYMNYLAPGDAPDPLEVLGQLLSLEVVQYAVGAHRERDDQFVELVQVSADVAHPLGGPTTATQKLAGAQLANFGGFYKKSWRANDWMFGRLDGANRLVRILLNPARVARLYPNDAETVLATVRRIAIPADDDPDVKDREYLERSWQSREPAMRRELSYLTDPEIPVPEQLPETANAILLRHQVAIVRYELPVITATASEDRGLGAGDASAGLIAATKRAVGQGTPSDWRSLDTDQLVALYSECNVGAEKISNEIGADLFTSQVVRTLAVAVTLFSGPTGGLGFGGRLLKGLRLPLLVIHALMQNAINASRTAAFVSGLVLATSSAIVLLALFTTVLPSTVEAFGSLAFAALIAIALRRHMLLVVLWTIACVAVAIAAKLGWLG